MQNYAQIPVLCIMVVKVPKYALYAFCMNIRALLMILPKMLEIEGPKFVGATYCYMTNLALKSAHGLLAHGNVRQTQRF